MTAGGGVGRAPSGGSCHPWGSGEAGPALLLPGSDQPVQVSGHTRPQDRQLGLQPVAAPLPGPGAGAGGGLAPREHAAHRPPSSGVARPRRRPVLSVEPPLRAAPSSPRVRLRRHRAGFTRADGRQRPPHGSGARGGPPARRRRSAPGGERGAGGGARCPRAPRGARQEGAGGHDATGAQPADRERRAGADPAAGTEWRPGLGVRARSAGQGGAPGTRPGPRRPSPPARRRVWPSGDQRPRAPRDAGPRPSPPGPPGPPGRPPAHLSRERPQAREPRSSRVAASTTAAILGLRPPLLASLPAPRPAPRPPGAGPCRSGARFRCAERKPRREAGSGGRAAGDGGGGLAPRPGRSRSHGAAAAGLGRDGAPGPAAMSGYARRPGVSPLSRARSLVIPDGERPAGGRGRAGWRTPRAPGLRPGGAGVPVPGSGRGRGGARPSRSPCCCSGRVLRAPGRAPPARLWAAPRPGPRPPPPRPPAGVYVLRAQPGAGVRGRHR